MDSPQSVVSPFKNLSVTGETEKQNPDVYVKDSGYLPKGAELHRNEMHLCNSKEDSIGVLDVHIHQARDIHNICIYHKQDVYAKICLTSDPEKAVSTQIINGGGRNPVFNESLRVSVRTVESSLKCEVWMLSRVRNYLEDQLLGFAIVPLSDVLVSKGKLEKEFSLSSTDLYHSPAGFVQLSVKYSGVSPEVMLIQKLPNADSTSIEGLETIRQETSEYDKLEFPDPNIANENQMMVTEYFNMGGSSSLDSQSTQSPVSSEMENQFSSETVVHHPEESFSANSADFAQLSKPDSPISMSTNGSPAIQPASSQSSETPIDPLKSPKQDEHISPLKEKKGTDDFTAEHVPNVEKDDLGDSRTDTSNGPPKESAFNPLGTINVKLPEEKVVQQDFVDMYMKSMQQFSESLAKMKLPMDLETNSNSSTSDPNVQTPKTPGSRVFYGSRAFF